MVTVTASEARKNFAKALRQTHDGPVAIEKHGEPEAVLIAPSLFERLLQTAEELDDIAAFDDAMSEEGDNIPWDIAKADLGWV